MKENSGVYKTIEGEIRRYQDETVDLAEGVSFSQYKLVRRISLFENQQYPKGNLDSQGDYKYWYDIISPRVNGEVKNIDFDSNNIVIYSDSINDRVAIYLSNLELGNWLKTTGQSEELNDAVEEFSALGNVVWKKVKDGYERADLKNFYVLNQTAKTLNESAVIERHLMTQSQLRDKSSVWKNIDKVIKACGNKQFAATSQTTSSDTSNPYYEIFERNGEIKESELFEAQGKSGGSDEKWVLAKVILAGLKSKGDKSKKYVLFAETMEEMPYREAHRGRYKGKWWREGMYEILFDCQTRANAIGNQLSKGLEWASKTIFRTSDDSFVQNLLTDLKSGDILRSRDLAQVDVRMQGLDQMMVDWNRNIQVADMLANSYEVVQGQTMPSNTPFKLGSLLDQNANKLFDFLREKLSIGLTSLIESWILPTLIKDLKSKKIIDLTNSEENLKDFYKMVVDSWYLKNLLKLPPHSPEMAQTLKETKLEQLIEGGKAEVEVIKGFWSGFKPRAKVVITGENVRLAAELESLFSFIQLEVDPIRRSALIEMAMAKRNIDISSLPKTPPEQLLAQSQPASQSNPANANKEAMAAKK